MTMRQREQAGVRTTQGAPVSCGLDSGVCVRDQDATTAPDLAGDARRMADSGVAEPVISDGKPACVLSALAHREKRGLGKPGCGKARISGAGLSISWPVVRLTA